MRLRHFRVSPVVVHRSSRSGGETAESAAKLPPRFEHSAWFWSKKLMALRAKNLERSFSIIFWGTWSCLFRALKGASPLFGNCAFSLGIPRFYILLTVAGTAKLLSYEVCRGFVNVGWTSWMMPPHSFMVSSRNCHSAACELARNQFGIWVVSIAQVMGNKGHSGSPSVCSGWMPSVFKFICHVNIQMYIYIYVYINR